MSWLAELILDSTPWWVWLLAAAGLLAATYQFWAPLWALVPRPARLALIAAAAGLLAYLAGRNKGASGALARAKEKDEAHAKDIDRRAAEARSAAGRATDRDGMSDDGWRRD